MHLRSLLTTAACALALAACGSDDDTSSSGAAEASAPAAESGAFPVKIPHRYGTTVIDAEPERVVIAGLREQDAALALGVVPVAATEWYGKHPGAVFPWAEEALGDADPPAVLTYEDGLQIEKIAAQRPDLIIAVYSGMTKKEYAAYFLSDSKKSYKKVPIPWDLRYGARAGEGRWAKDKDQYRHGG